MKKLISLTVCALAMLTAWAQGYEHWIDADVAPGWTLPTSKYFRGVNPGNRRFGPMFQGSLRWHAAFSPADAAARLYPGLYTALGFRLQALARDTDSLTAAWAGTRSKNSN